MSKCIIHTEQALKYIYERNGTGTNQKFDKVFDTKVCIKCLVGIWAVREEAML